MIKSYATFPLTFKSHHQMNIEHTQIVEGGKSEREIVHLDSRFLHYQTTIRNYY